MEHHLLEQARHADARCVPVPCNCASYHRGPDASSLTMGAAWATELAFHARLV
jgi:hypothetical protein